MFGSGFMVGLYFSPLVPLWLGIIFKNRGLFWLGIGMMVFIGLFLLLTRMS